MELAGEIIEGTFIKENKHRFIGLVRIEEEVWECYIPNTSRMEKYINLKNKRVLLTVNKSPDSRTRYSLFAVKHYNSFILLNLNFVNAVIEMAINREFILPPNRYQITKECVVAGYKADLLLEDGEDKIIVEGKGVISTKKSVLFPTVYSERFTRQLLKLKQLLYQGWKVHYYIVSLSPFVKQITLDASKGEYYDLLKACINLGMRIQAVSVSYKAKAIKVDTGVSIKGA